MLYEVITGANGVAEIAIAATGEEEIVGYYLVKATDPASNLLVQLDHLFLL